MMKISLVYRFISSFLIVAVLVSSMGIAVDMHFCNNVLKSVSFSSKAKPCHEPSLKQCPFHSKILVDDLNEDKENKKGCCENKTKYFHIDQDQQIETFDYKLFQSSQLFIVAFINVFFLNGYVEEDVLSYKHYRPPIIQKDIPVLIQSFLL